MHNILSPHINSNKIFIVQFSDLTGRIDAQFYKESFKFESFLKLSKVAFVKGGKRIPLEKSYSEMETPYLYLRVADMNDDKDIDFNTLKFIDEDVFNILERYEIKENDLAISIARTIGKTVLIKNIPTHKRIILTENCAKIVLKDDSILPQYFELILNLPIVQKQIELNYIQTTIPKLGLDRINNLQIPQFPKKDIQQQIVNIYQTAYQQKQQYETQAEQLLASIDDYLLGELGITLPTENSVTDFSIKQNGFELNKQNSVVQKGRLFLTGFKEIGGGRFDAEYYQQKYKENIAAIRNGKYQAATIKEILSGHLIKGTLPKQEEKDGENSVIQINCINNDGTFLLDDLLTAKNIFNDEQKLQESDILVVITGATIGKVAVWNYGGNYYLGGDIVKFQTNPEISDNSFVFNFLRCVLSQTEIKRNITGATNGHLSPDDVKKMPIPLPPLEKQQEITTHISEIRQQA